MAVLNDLCQAVGADAGGTLYLDDGDGTLLLAASSATAGVGLAGVVRRLTGGAGKRDRRTLVLPIGGAGDGVAVLKRKTGAEFTQQDRAVARLYARRFTDDGVVA